MIYKNDLLPWHCRYLKVYCTSLAVVYFISTIVMSAFSDRNFEAILALVKRAVSDNEKFAAMMIVSKGLSPGVLPKEKLHTLLESIGLQFPCRLLSTACKPTGHQETRESYAAIASSVIKLFCICHYHNGIDMKPVIPVLLKGIKTFSNYVSCKDMLDDCWEALISLLKRKLDIDYVGIFNVAISSPHSSQEKLLAMLKLVLQNCPEISETEQFEDWMNYISSQFKTEKDSQKFKICKTLCCVFQNLLESSSSKVWLDDVMIGLGDILCSKVTQEQQCDAIELASELLSLYGLPLFIEKSRQKNFIVLVTRLSCIEVGLFFQDVISQRSEFSTKQENLSVILPCFKIIEVFCAAIAQFEQNEMGVVADLLNFEQIRLAQPTLCEMAGSVKEYISLILAKDVELDQKEKQLFHACLRVFGSWMNIEYNLSSPQGDKALLIVPALLKYVWSAKDSQLIKFILPAVMLSIDSSGMGTSTVQEIFLILCNILNDLMKRKSSCEFWSEEETIIKPSIQCIIAMCQSQFEAIGHNTEVISDVASSIKHGISKYDRNLVTDAYIYTLAISLLNRFPLIRCESNELFLKCLDFLFGAFKVPVTSKLELDLR